MLIAFDRPRVGDGGASRRCRPLLSALTVNAFAPVDAVSIAAPLAAVPVQLAGRSPIWRNAYYHASTD